jgi:hypothetical protein
MKYYVGLDVAMEETAICIVDDQRRVVRESKAVAGTMAVSPRAPAKLDTNPPFKCIAGGSV